MKNFLQAIESFFGSAWHTLLDYLHIAIPEATVALMNEALSLADPIVADLQNQSLTGQQKRDRSLCETQSRAKK